MSRGQEISRSDRSSIISGGMPIVAVSIAAAHPNHSDIAAPRKLAAGALHALGRFGILAAPGFGRRRPRTASVDVKVIWKAPMRCESLELPTVLKAATRGLPSIATAFRPQQGRVVTPAMTTTGAA